MKNRFIKRGLLTLGLFILSLTLSVGLGAATALAACGGSTNVATENELNAAIADYNSQASPCSYTISLTADIPLTAQTTTIDNSNGTSLQINGNNHILDGAGSYRLFTILDSTVTVADLTLQNGYGPEECADFLPHFPSCGGAVKVGSAASVTLTQTSLISNTASVGGGLLNDGGVVTIIASTISGNAANQYGGGLENYDGSMTISNSTIANNASYFGGGISNDGIGVLTITDSTLAGNAGNSRGGGLYHGGELATISNSAIANNSAIDGRGGGVTNNGVMLVSNSIIAGNLARDEGGGLFNNSDLELAQVTISDNQAALGGGMYSEASSPILTNITFSGNTASDSGGGMYNFQSTPTLTAVTLSSNSAAYYGGGLANIALINGALTNVTLSGNQADVGGGIFNIDSDPTLIHVTITGNTAVTGGGGLSNIDSSPVLNNVILWDNSAPTGPQIANETGLAPSNPAISYSDIQGSGGSGAGWNTLLGTDQGGNLDTDPLLAPLANNGGETETYALLAGSPAINHIPNGTNGCGTTVTSDQRGITRPQGVGCDIGAFEVGVSDSTAPVITPNASGTLGNNGWYVSNVEVSWTVSDNGSTISSTNGCETTIINSDTAGATLTCEATSDGGANSANVTIQRDATAPTVSVTGVEEGASYEVNEVPTAGCDTQDALSGVVTQASLATIGGNGNGLGSFTATCDGAIDNAGNSAAPVSVSYTVTESLDSYEFKVFLPLINKSPAGQ